MVLAAAVLFAVRLGGRAVVSEVARWAEVAREMRDSGDYLHPTINGRAYPDKPAGSYWLVVAASHLTGGVDETAARLPAAVAGVAGVWVVTLLGRRLYADAVFDLGRTAPEYLTAAELAAAVDGGRVRWVVGPRRLAAAVGVRAEVSAEEAARPWESPDRAGDELVLWAVTP